MDDKTALRVKFKNLRKTFDLADLSRVLTEKIKNSVLYKNAWHIMIFYPTKYEIDVRGLLSDDTKKFYLPRVNGEDLEVCPFREGDALLKSSYNIMEPLSEPVGAEGLDLAIVPALAVDRQNYRLGYGGGFYDRFLAKNLNVKTIVPICSKQVVDSLLVDVFDKAVDLVITE